MKTITFPSPKLGSDNVDSLVVPSRDYYKYEAEISDLFKDKKIGRECKTDTRNHFVFFLLL